jgi:hypothetical protein
MRWIALVVSIVGFAWAIFVRVYGPLVVTLAGLRILSTDVRRPAVVAVVAAAIYLATSGWSQARRDMAAVRGQFTPGRAAGLLAGFVLMIGFANNSWTAGGADSYAYVTQADLLLQGMLTVPVPLAVRAPWPDALTTFTPFGYRAVPREPAVAPATGLGLPLLMAGFKAAFGHAAGFLVVPITGALLVWATFLVGSRVLSPTVGLAASWLTATSPTFLMMFKSQMSDVPAAAFWTLATYAVIGRTARAAFAAGAMSALAILIRPNLVPIAGVLFLWLVMVIRAVRRGGSPVGEPQADAGSPNRDADRRGEDGWLPPIAFVVGMLPGPLVVATINARLYGSPLSSGYGDLGQLFSLQYVPVTLSRYATWLAETQTPLAFAGIIVLAVAPRSLWPTPARRANAWLLTGVAAITWMLYSVYQPFGAWWFLRFLLPSWPALSIGTLALLAWLGRFRAGARVHAVAVIALGVYGLTIAWQRDVFPVEDGERRYATIASFVQRLTDPRAMIVSSVHAGPTRYYAGRATMRFDLLDPAWLDRAAGWLAQQGRHPYVLVEDWEMPMFTSRFAGNRLADLGAAPILAYRGYATSGTVYLFDLLRREGRTLAPPPIKDPRPLCPLPAAAPEL